MDKKEMNTLYIPFKTAKKTGTGLGMAQTYKVVSQHGGRISISSKKGSGTRVDILLPIAGG